MLKKYCINPEEVRKEKNRLRSNGTNDTFGYRTLILHPQEGGKERMEAQAVQRILVLNMPSIISGDLDKRPHPSQFACISLSCSCICLWQ